MKRLSLMTAALAATVLLLPLAASAGGTASIVYSPDNEGGGYTFGSGQTSQTFTLTNTGGKATGVLTITLQNESRYANFSITSDACSGTSLGPKKSCTVSVSVVRSNLETDIAQLFATSKTTSQPFTVFANPET
jgi:hypothetical protein